MFSSTVFLSFLFPFSSSSLAKLTEQLQATQGRWAHGSVWLLTVYMSACYTSVHSSLCICAPVSSRLHVFGFAGILVCLYILGDLKFSSTVFRTYRWLLFSH